MTVHHILVPTDFSDYANHALAYASELAQTLQSRITLLHIFHVAPLSLGDMPPAFLDTYLKELEADAQTSMQASLKWVQHDGLQVDTVIDHGIPFQAIVDTARDQQVDLIVMGTHGRTGLTHVLIGSVAEKVVRLAECPVLVTRRQADVQPR